MMELMQENRCFVKIVDPEKHNRSMWRAKLSGEPLSKVPKSIAEAQNASSSLSLRELHRIYGPSRNTPQNPQVEQAEMLQRQIREQILHPNRLQPIEQFESRKKRKRNR